MTSGPKTGRSGEDGYAIVAAVAALVVFASVSYAILAADRGDLMELRGQFTQARLEADAGAGLSLAIEGLAKSDATRRWPIDGRPIARSFNGDTLTIVIEDERGKAPLTALTASQLHRLFAAAGADPQRIETLVESYQDWFTPDATGHHGADLASYATRGLKPPNGGENTVDELARLNGMDAATFANIRRALTPYFGVSGSFTPRTASPLAISAMSEQGSDDGAIVERQHELAGDWPALPFSDDKSLAGHAVTVVVRADGAAGGHLERRTVVELTGKPSPAFFIRAVE